MGWEGLRVALAHDQLATAGGAGGAERFLVSLKELFPAAPIFTTVFNPQRMPPVFQDWDIRTSFIQGLPGGQTRYQYYLPLMPTAVERLNFDDYDLVISGSHSFMKGILTGPNTLHLCYCHSPIRYAWDFYHRYLQLEDLSRLERALVPWLMHYLRLWDQVSASRVDYYIANSYFVRRRIQKFYRREATVIYPPVDTHRFEPSTKQEDFYLIVGRMVAYKRMDLAVEAFNRNGRPLVIIGDGPEANRLKSSARANITFLGRQPDAVVTDYLQRCRGFIFPGEEDFGIAPVEAMACGKPVLAYGRGGALETIIAGQSGVFFEEPSADSLNQALTLLTESDWNPFTIARHAEKFSQERFAREVENFVTQKLAEFAKGDRLL